MLLLYCKFWIYWMGVNTTFTIWQLEIQNLQYDIIIFSETSIWIPIFYTIHSSLNKIDIKITTDYPYTLFFINSCVCFYVT